MFAFDVTYPSAKLAPVPVCVCAGTFDIFKKPPDQMPQPSKLSEAPEPRERGTVLSFADGCVINNGNGGFCKENVTFLTHVNFSRGLQTVSTGRTICKQRLPKMAWMETLPGGGIRSPKIQRTPIEASSFVIILWFIRLRLPFLGIPVALPKQTTLLSPGPLRG